MQKLLTIGITSYNRPKELRRCLDSIKTVHPELIEVIISEDASPKREEIKKQIEEFKAYAPFTVIENYNENNLGYDRNLDKLKTLADGEFILYISDDDALMTESLDLIITFLENHKEQTYLLYTAYRSKSTKSTNRQYANDFKIDSGREATIKYLYDAILFSGLIFRLDAIRDVSAERFVNLNYFQVYLFMLTMYKYGAYYLKIQLVDCIMDGENGYGTTELSKRDPLLADRSNIYSNIQFNKGLVQVIKIFDKDQGEKIIEDFSKEYSLRTYRGMAKARAAGRDELREYWNRIHDIGIKIRFPAQVYYITLIVFGNKVCDKVYDIPRKILFSLRSKQ